MRFFLVLGLGLVLAACGSETTPASVGVDGGAGGDGGSAASISSASSGGGGASSSSSASSSASNSSSSSSSSSNTETIAPPECVLAQDCPGVDSECRERTCLAGKCGVDLEADGTPLAAQTVGDCQRVVCDGAGSTRVDYDAADIISSQSECIVDTCTLAGAEHKNVDNGSTCTSGLCVYGDCKSHIEVQCKTTDGEIYTGCGLAPVSKWFVSFEIPGGWTLCNTLDLKYCAPGTACHVYDGTTSKNGHCL